MKRIYSILMSAGTLLLFSLQMSVFTSCSDDMPAENYYTFTGEMMDDYLKNREQFSMFRRVVERAGYMNILHSRGKYVMFPPTNEAMSAYLAENNYASVDDMPLEECNTLACEHLADQVGDNLYTEQVLLDKGSFTNWLEIQYLTFKMSDADNGELDENGLPYMIVNTYSKVINTLKNDSCENGMVHPVDRVIMPSTDLGNEFLNTRQEEFTIFYEVCRLTGMLDVLNTPYEDESYHAEDFPDPYPRLIQSGFSNEWYCLKRPDRRLQGFTVFAVTDETFKTRRGIDASDLEEAVNQVYNLAVSLYEPVAEDLGITAQDKELYWKQDENAYRNPKNPLNMFISYHILDRRFPSLDKFINCWGVKYKVVAPTEWVSTLLEHSSMKIEYVFRNANIDPLVEHATGYWLNHHYDPRGYVDRVRGAYVSVPEDNLGLNCSLYYVDDILAYDTEMRTKVMNTRIRTDFMTLWPELTTNDIRLNGDPNKDNSSDRDESYSAGKNYYMPPGYLKNVTLNDDAIFFVMRPHRKYYGWGGDEINFLGSSYDCTFRIPSVPSGTYEIRLGISGGHDTRGVAQIYFDGRPQGIPIDMRKMITDPTIGGILPRDLSGDEAVMENNQTLKNNGFYRGGRSQFAVTQANDVNNPLDISDFDGQAQFENIPENYRIVICKVDITGSEYHTIRVRSVFNSASDAAFMLDYLEIVPNSICGVGGFGEDLN